MMLAFVCPGQGAQSPGYLHRLPSAPVVRDTLDEAGAALGLDVLQLDAEPALQSTEAVQAGLVVAGVAMARLLRSHGVEPDLVAGLSVGAFTAAVVAGVLDFADALRVVRLRGRSMAETLGSGWGMLAVGGLSQRALERLLAQHDASHAAPHAQLYLANLNAPTQFVVAGEVVALDALARRARDAGARQTERLQVAVASHCPPLAPTADALRRALAGVAQHAPRPPVVGNVSARVLRDAPAVVRELADGVMRPVRWHDSQVAMVERGLRCIVELPPGRTLQAQLRALPGEVTAIAACGATASEVERRVRRACAARGGDMDSS